MRGGPLGLGGHRLMDGGQVAARRHLVVVESDDRHRAGHNDSGAPQGPQRAERHLVTHRDQTRR